MFAADPGIRAVQGYTTDRRLVRQAVARVIPSGTNEEERTANRTDELTGGGARSREREHMPAAAPPLAAGPALAARAGRSGNVKPSCK